MALEKVAEMEGRSYLELVNPANGEKIFNPVTGTSGDRILINTEKEVSAAVNKAGAAYRFWRFLSVKERGRYFQALKHEIVKHSDAIAKLIGEETGKNTAECWEEIVVVLELLNNHRKKGLAGSKKFRGGALNICKKISTSIVPDSRRKEFGVAGVITPWNYPFMIPLNIITRTLFYGNTVVLKPSEQTPYCGELIRYLAKQAWEKSGLQKHSESLNPITVIQGDGEVGKTMVDLLNKDEINFLFLCGSSGAGSKVKQAAKDKSKLELLLGGKDALIILEDADLDKATDAVVGGCLFNTGQSCSSVERVYVAESIADQVISRVLEKVRKMQIGYNPEDHSVDLGPIMNKRQFFVLLDHLLDAKSKGVKILCGGKGLYRGIYDNGYWFEPTVLVDVNHRMQIMTEETFGPMIPIMTAKSEEELIQLANDSRFGLTASIWTKDLQRGKRIAERIQAGTVYVNDLFWTATESKVHWPGAKESGNAIGEEGSVFKDQVIAVTKGGWLDRMSSFWLKKNTPGKVRILKTLVKVGYRF